MTKDNDDALRCAGELDFRQKIDEVAALEIRRLVAENEAQAALLRQAMEAMEKLGTFDVRPSSIWRHYYPSSTGDYVNLREFREKAAPTIAAIHQHLEVRQ